MENEYVANMTMDDMLEHHGVRGMKWGIRRYQNKDGSLTAAGKRRLAKIQGKRAELEGEEERLTKQPVKAKTKNPHGKKSVFDMDDDELRSEISRLDLEKKYRDYMKDLYPSKKKEPLIDGRKVAGEILTGSLTSVGKSVVTNVTGAQINKLGKSLGLEYNLYTTSEKKKK